LPGGWIDVFLSIPAHPLHEHPEFYLPDFAEQDISAGMVRLGFYIGVIMHSLVRELGIIKKNKNIGLIIL
jgi:hypothetical protein